MKTFAIVHNIPSPYRVYLFGLLNAELARWNRRLVVHFLATGHADRAHWTPGQMDFEHRTWRDIGFMVSGKEWHLNPGLIAEMLLRPPTHLMVGGPWDSISGPIISTLTQRRSRLVAWIEGNTRTPGRMTGLPLKLKRWLLGRFDYVAVPGGEAVRLVEQIVGEGIRERVVMLPNVVDESRFRRSTWGREAARLQLRLRAGERMALWPARLIEEKNVLATIEALDADMLAGWQVMILGDGPLLPDIVESIGRRGLGGRVRVSRAVDYAEMPKYYAAADLFLLPSLKDPNPLSVVEAMHAGLPVLISDRLGNYPEALDAGVNGWGCDPTSSRSIEQGCRAAFGAHPTQLEKMGRESERMANRMWASRKVVAQFVERVLTTGSCGRGDGETHRGEREEGAANDERGLH